MALTESLKKTNTISPDSNTVALGSQDLCIYLLDRESLDVQVLRGQRNWGSLGSSLHYSLASINWHSTR